MAHYNKEKGIFEGTMYPPLGDDEVTKAERKKREDTVKANQEKCMLSLYLNLSNSFTWTCCSGGRAQT